MINKIAKFKIPWYVSMIVLISTLLFWSHQIGIKAAGNVIFAGQVVAIIPVAGCQYSNLSCSGTCPICQCGPWSQVLIAPYGAVSTFFMCQSPSMIPFGAPIHVGGLVFGYAPANWVFSNNGASTNIWSL